MGEVARAALVTGAGKRVGRALALALARDGHDVAVHCHRSRAEAEEFADLVRSAGRRAVVLVADLAREIEAAALVAAAAEALGTLGGAGQQRLDLPARPSRDPDRASWDAHIENNLRSPVVLMRDFVRHLPGRGARHVVNMLDQRVHNLTPNFLSYSVSRLGLWGATQVLARELAPRVRLTRSARGPPPRTRDGRGALPRDRGRHAAAPRPHARGARRGACSSCGCRP